MNFSHSGAIGDIVYHLPIVKKLGGGVFHILPCSRYPTSNDAQFKGLAPLLERQSYITRVEWSERPVGINFDAWRARLDFGKNLTDQAAQWLGMDSFDPLESWLDVTPNLQAPVVFARSHQINFSHTFDWPMLVRKYKGRSVFLGHPDEHEVFCRGYGEVPYYPTGDLLEAARVIAGSRLFIGNPTALTAIAEGLKVNTIIASAPFVDHCVYYKRPNVQHCWDDVFPPEV